jgi:hypothetical protein
MLLEPASRLIGAACVAVVVLVARDGAFAQSQQPLHVISPPDAWRAPAIMPWSVSMFAGPLTTRLLSESFTGEFEFESGIAGIAVSRRLGMLTSDLVVEGELQLIQHFAGEDHFEGNLVVAARWIRFPWNRVLPTTFALGLGPSFATSLPEQERRRHGHHSSAVLNEFFGEVTIGAPGLPRWALVGRMEHRSGIFGLINGVHDASTAFGYGLKYRF